MDIRQKISDILHENIADIFMMEKDHIASHPELNFRTDLKATSLQYYPLITELEDQLGIDIDAHDFQWKAHTIGEAVDFLMNLYSAQK